MNRQQFAVLLLLAALWGASFLLIKIGVAEMAPETLVMLRLVVSALVLLGVLYARGERLPADPRAWRDMFFLGATGLVAPYLLITWAEQSLQSGMTAILNATTPLFAVLLTYLWTREDQLGGLRALGVLVGFVGVVVAVGVGNLRGVASDVATLLPQLAVLLAALCYALSGIYARRAFRGMSPLVPATGQLVAGAALITPVALLLHGVPSPLPSPAAFGAVLVLAVFGTAVANVMLYWLIARVGATRTSMVTYLLPPFALVYGALFLREQITAGALLGLGLVVLGILLANGVLRMPTARAEASVAGRRG